MFKVLIQFELILYKLYEEVDLVFRQVDSTPAPFPSYIVLSPVYS